MKNILFWGALFLLVGSCNNPERVDKESFKKIELGMDKQEVVTILGEPSIKNEDDPSTVIYSYLNKLPGKRYASITFNKNGKVSSAYYENPE